MTDPLTETTDTGEQHLIDGVKPVTVRDKLQLLAEAPLAPQSRQRPCVIGLFDEVARKQPSLF